MRNKEPFSGWTRPTDCQSHSLISRQPVTRKPSPLSTGRASSLQIRTEDSTATRLVFYQNSRLWRRIPKPGQGPDLLSAFKRFDFRPPPVEFGFASPQKPKRILAAGVELDRNLSLSIRARNRTAGLPSTDLAKPRQWAATRFIPKNVVQQESCLLP